MKLELENGRDFIEILKQLKDIFTELKLVITEEGLKTGMLDPSHTMFLGMNLPKDIFKNFEFDESEECDLGIDLDKISKIKTAGTDGLIITLSDKDEICFNLYSKNATKKYKFGNILIDADIRNVPVIDYNNKALIKASMLIEHISSFTAMSEIIEVIFDDNEIKLKSKEGITELEIDIDTNDNQSVLSYTKNDEEVIAKFRVEYLAKILKTLKISDYIELSLNNGTPIKLDANIFGGGEISFFLAPLVD